VRSSGFFSRADDVQLSALIGKKGSNAVLFKYFAGCDPRAIFEKLRARGLWDENAPLAPDQQHPVKPMVAEPAQSDPAALALRRRRAAAPCRDRIECC
jgi:hypothetical protein